jgi:hydroxypyruvate reductase
VRLPANPGDGGRATQLALALARHLRGSDRSAFVAASDGRDGNTWSAGAYVNGASWDTLVRAGIDPDAELARCNAADTLAGLGAVFMPGPTGINHADVVILG